MSYKIPQRPSDPDPSLLPRDPATGEPLPPTREPGYYPGFSTLSQSAFWDKATRDLIARRVGDPPSRSFFTEPEWLFWTAVFAHILPQTDRTPDRQVPILPVVDHRLAINQTAGYRYEDMPPDQEAYRLGHQAIDAEAQARFAAPFLDLPHLQQDQVLEALAHSKPKAARDIWKKMSIERFWQLLVGDAIDAYYAHPFAWDEIGFGGPAYPRAYTRLERGEPEPWEVKEQRHDWLAPTMSVSDRAKAVDVGDQRQSHHGSGGTH